MKYELWVSIIYSFIYLFIYNLVLIFFTYTVFLEKDHQFFICYINEKRSVANIFTGMDNYVTTKDTLSFDLNVQF